MLADHYSDVFIGHFSWLNLIGRISFPIFAFQAVQGYIHTKNVKKHLTKLLIFACISQYPFMLFLSTFSDKFALNIFFTFFFALFTLWLYDKCKNKLLGFLIVVVSSMIGSFIKLDYGAFGILLIFVFYFFEKDFNKIYKLKTNFNKLLMSITVILLTLAKYSYPSFKGHYLLCALFTSLSLVFILQYNKKEGPKSKYFFYIFYPLHLLILYFISTHI